LSRCDLSIRFEQQDRSYRSGAWIVGEVEATVDAPVRCRRLSATLNWRTHGKGNSDEGPGQPLALFEGDWAPGVYRYPFRFMAPSAPATYHGELVNVDHYVTVRADVPWAIDPKAEADILVLGGGAAEFGGRAPKGIAPAEVQKVMGVVPNLAIGCGGIVALICLVIMGMAVASSVARGSGALGILLDALSTIPAPLFLVAGLLGVGWGLMHKMRAARLGEPEVTVEPLRPKVGGEVSVVIAISPRADVTLEDVSFDLVCAEVATRGSGTNETHHRHEVSRAGQVLDGGGTVIPAGQTVRRSGRLAIPVGSPVTFSSANNRVSWMLQARVRVAGWPAWSLDVPLTVSL
jgi:hypothetical protein